MHAFRPRTTVLLAVAVVMACAVASLGVGVVSGVGGGATARSSSAAVGPSGGYTTQRWSCLGAAANADGSTSGAEASGQLDATGVLWQLCQDHVLRDDGHAVATMPFPTQDIAPSPDGTRLYAMQAGGTVRRLLVAADGSLVDDPGWHLDPFTAGGRSWTPGGWSLATDAWGDIFVSNGGWRPDQPKTILEYGSDGHLKAQFGGPQTGTADGLFEEDQGLAVTPDGRRVYVADHLNCRVQVFDRGSDGQFRYAKQWGGCDVDDETPGKFSAVYDVALDRQGGVYVADTTWNRVQRFTADGTYVEQLLATPYATAQVHPHFVTVDRRGTVLVGQVDQRFVPSVPDTAPTPVPMPLGAADTSAPTIDSVGVPAVVAIGTTALTFPLRAHDDGAVDEVRVAGGDGAWSAWRPYEETLGATLVASAAPQVVLVQVRDAAGNESAVVASPVRWAATATASVVAAPVVAPDRAAPTMVVAAVRMRAATATVTLTTRDARSASVQLRRRLGLRGRWGAWTRVRRNATTTVRLAAGVHELDLQARDAAGNATAVRRVRLPRTATTVLVLTR